MHTFMGKSEKYNMFGIGAYTLVKLGDLEIQTFQCPMFTSPTGRSKVAAFNAAVAIKYGDETIIIDENSVLTVFSSAVMGPSYQMAPNDEEMSKTVSEKIVVKREKGLVRTAGKWQGWRWHVSLSDDDKKPVANYIVDSRTKAQMTAGSWNRAWRMLAKRAFFTWVELYGDSHLDSEGLCRQPCASNHKAGSTGYCQNPACHRLDNSSVIFDPTTYNRLWDTCEVSKFAAPKCEGNFRVKGKRAKGQRLRKMDGFEPDKDAEEQDVEGMEAFDCKNDADLATEWAAAKLNCSALDTPACADFFEDCAFDFCAGVADAAEVYVDECATNTNLGFGVVDDLQ